MTRFKLIQWGSPIMAAWLIGYAFVYLSPSLPDRYAANHWRLVWVLLDVAMAVLALTTWLLVIKRSPFAIITATGVSTLLIADAWFDCFTAQGTDLSQSVLSLTAELPVAGVFLWFSVMELRGLVAEPDPLTDPRR